MSSPIETARAVEQALGELLDAASPGPWTVERRANGVCWVNLPKVPHALSCHGFSPEAALIALAPLALAGQVVAWLEQQWVVTDWHQRRPDEVAKWFSRRVAAAEHLSQPESGERSNGE